MPLPLYETLILHSMQQFSAHSTFSRYGIYNIVGPSALGCVIPYQPPCRGVSGVSYTNTELKCRELLAGCRSSVAERSCSKQVVQGSNPSDSAV